MWTTGGRTRISDVLTSTKPLDDVTVMAWLRSARVSKGVAFLTLSDGSCMTPLQAVVPAESDCYEVAGNLATGAAVRVRGELIESPAKGQAWELKANELEELGSSDESYPLQKKRHTFEYMRTIAHLRPRANAYQAVFRVRNALSYAIHRFFQERGFLYVHTPIITASDAEGAGEMFAVTTLDIDGIAAAGSTKVDYSKDFFGRRAGLTVSGQLEAEIFSSAFSDVYTFGPTFRAENSNTTRHVAEFWMIEPEIAFADLRDDLRLAEDFMRSITKEVMERCPDDMEFFAKRVDKSVPERLAALTDQSYEVLTYTEAVKILEKADEPFEYPVSFGVDLQSEHERYLTEKVLGRPVFIIDYPKEIKAFYMRMNDDERTVAAVDLLVPGVGEIIGGSQREERHDVLLSRIEELGLPPDNYWWYLDLRRYGSVKHAGFGLGFERLLMYLTGMGNIRDVVPFPRTRGHAEF